MKALEYFRKMFKKEGKTLTTKSTIEEDNESNTESYEDVYTHAFDRPIKKKFVGIHREGSLKYKKMKIKKEKSDKEDKLTM